MANKMKRATIFSTDQNVESPVFVAFNGKQMYVPQGVEVEIDEDLITVLQTAIDSVPSKYGQRADIKPRFHVTVHGDVEKPKTPAKVKDKDSLPLDKLD